VKKKIVCVGEGADKGVCRVAFTCCFASWCD